MRKYTTITSYAVQKMAGKNLIDDAYLASNRLFVSFCDIFYAHGCKAVRSNGEGIHELGGIPVLLAFALARVTEVT